MIIIGYINIKSSLIQCNLSILNLHGINYFVWNRQVLSYTGYLNTDFLHWNFISGLVYSGFSLDRFHCSLVYSGFYLDRFHCIFVYSGFYLDRFHGSLVYSGFYLDRFHCSFGLFRVLLRQVSPYNYILVQCS